MSINRLRIYNARNLEKYSLQLYPSFNIFHGSNGVGKTTILESIYLLLRARTFRSSKYKTFINHESTDCTIFTQFTSESNNNFTLAISRSKNIAQPIFKLNSSRVYSISTISHLVLLGLITPESFNLLDSGPSIRRKFIDWGVFHVEPGFMNNWRSYKKVLSNRNNILRILASRYGSRHDIPDFEINNLNCWSPQLVQLNNSLNKFRENQVRNIEPIFKEVMLRFSPILSENISLEFYRGWTNDLDYKDYLIEKLTEDFNAANTRFGTHRSELRINYKNKLAKEILSRGQKKIVILSLIISQFIYLSKLQGSSEHRILLLDDIDSELDEFNLEILLSILKEMKCQKMITTTNKNKFNFIDKHEDSKMFHVKPE